MNTMQECASIVKVDTTHTDRNDLHGSVSMVLTNLRWARWVKRAHPSTNTKNKKHHSTNRRKRIRSNFFGSSIINQSLIQKNTIPIRKDWSVHEFSKSTFLMRRWPIWTKQWRMKILQATSYYDNFGTSTLKHKAITFQLTSIWGIIHVLPRKRGV